MDVSGGLSAVDDLPILDPARDLDAGENHAFWCFDRAGDYALLNCHVQAGGVPGQPWPSWDVRRVGFGITAPADRLYIDWAVEPGTTSDTLRTGGWTFRCVEPMRRWTASYHGTPVATTTTEHRRGVNDLTGERVPIDIELELAMAMPPWIQGSFAEHLSGRDTALTFIGVPRFEQLYHAVGSITIDGARHALEATGLRTHRYGPRSLVRMRGHSWLTALFPSGRAFGCMKFPDPDNGGELFREAWVSGPDGLVGARLIDAPWLSGLDCTGETWSVQLVAPDGPCEIRGETVAVSYSMGLGVNHAPGSYVLAHAMGRFEWDGETTYGLIERSAPIEELT